MKHTRIHCNRPERTPAFVLAILLAAVSVAGWYAVVICLYAVPAATEIRADASNSSDVPAGSLFF